ncbi:hypothetical protein KMW28_03285 [Flammeovirga yaeyamensis]|uniref:DUF6377 domain-containing protein n=1 Tax=Flammeovirga yaeyamensis TaxID=367791 RepID=A0AAX1N9G8_9BACT|nr:DUF6377 domain-containing protein [Flammeovirga yaeyamensis]MBB3701333.1 hypothetical protein [Flammeovirga yaeyamensis]NMF38199.1 hypothetical protein [Flammeovirga yaeyamensis]QWG02613.1 hypothetical protein KMW28_03285 [Flammeovirga yaeyamensis]
MRILFFLFILSSIITQGKDFDSELSELDIMLDERDTYVEKRIQDIKYLKQRLYKEKSALIKYEMSLLITQQYIPYNSDSALHYAENTLEFANTIQSSDYIIQAKLLLAQAYSLVGLYHESILLLDTFKNEEGLGSYKELYHSINASLYNSLTLMNIDGEFGQKYRDQWNYHEEKIVEVTNKEALSHRLAVSELLKTKGDLKKAIQYLQKIVDEVTPTDRIYAPATYMIAEAYGQLGNTSQKIKYLIMSSKSDIQCGVKEHASLKELAVELYKAGEIKRAYKYIKIALDDALTSNTQLRRHEVLEILPLIDSTYQESRERTNRIMLWFIVVSVALVLLMMFLLFFIQKQKRKLEDTNQEVKDKNHLLSELNEELQSSKEQVEAINTQLRSFNERQEESITKYLKLSSAYIGKFDDYRKNLLRKANKSPKDEILKLLKSKEIVDHELKEFYHDFDKSFLKLYPNFVAEYNSLMKEEAQIKLKKSELLNTELRVFALLRLGIEESSQIAEFLRYSITTIYNYRTKARNNALAGRDNFEVELMKIGHQ